MICGDPRGIKAFGPTCPIAGRGPDNLRAEPFFELAGRHGEAERRLGGREAGTGSPITASRAGGVYGAPGVADRLVDHVQKHRSEHGHP